MWTVPDFLQPAFQLPGTMNVIEGARRHFLLVVQHQSTHASRESRGKARYQVAASVLQEVQSSPQMDHGQDVNPWIEFQEPVQFLRRAGIELGSHPSLLDSMLGQLQQ